MIAPPQPFRTLVVALAVVAAGLAGTASAPGGIGTGEAWPRDLVPVIPVRPSDFVYFVTPGKLASCAFYGDFAKAGYAPYLKCARALPSPQPAVVVTLRASGRPELAPFTVHSNLRLPRLIGVLEFGKTWWGNRGGRSGMGRSTGRILFRCTSRHTGLTCRNTAGHGFWLGRTRGRRVF